LGAKSNFWGFSFAAKYSVKLKLKIVRDHTKYSGASNVFGKKVWRCPYQHSATNKFEVLRGMMQESLSTHVLDKQA
jgi:hypothetical protein